ncbi:MULTISPECIES: metalloprotease PmbA [Oligella]|uniref:Peptidase PmbA n=1 Tax=Oligella urethralis DNF00040 TaxID=1401065 RepID=A0A095Z9W0_9BURK|nr:MULTISPECIES: metalloprotease PmbA [Oligella]KGF31428.1 peptidase PmbA [Oligella urethralis DNF00040]OFV46008.1 metalloprotease PmbA [Oligella sp. HMSC09E12]PMC19465.1 metalloprotease PmbA [Oligella urethralis]
MSVSSSDFELIVQKALAKAKELGASDASAGVSESAGLVVGVRQGQVETVERTRDRSLGVTVYRGKARGSASTSDLSDKALAETVAAAWNIARYTAEDEAAGLPDPQDLATDFRDLQLYKPWDIDPSSATELALQAEEAALASSDKITNSEGAQVNTGSGRFVMANSAGFMGGYQYSQHGISATVIAGKGDGMQRDYWYTANRYPERLQSPQQVGEIAAQRTVKRLNARKLPTGRYPVIYEAPLAIGLIGHLAQAISGGLLYRKSSFLLDSLGTELMPSHLTIHEDPFILGAMGSGTFDNEGVATTARDLLKDGILQGYLLSSYSARKLGMRTTGNAGGSHNLIMQSSLTRPEDSLAALLKKMDRGLLLTELIGRGVNYVTGDYSRGAFGYWVENGEIQYPVQEITIAGNLREMFQQIQAVGADQITRGAKTSGSVLIEQMAVAGA